MGEEQGEGAEPGAPVVGSRKLLARWQEEGELEALEELLAREILALKRRIRSEARGLTRNPDSASDVAQEVACRFLRSGDERWFESPASLRAYLWTAALNLLYARKRRDGMEATAGTGALDAARDPAGADGAAQLLAKERSVALRFAIELVGPRDREILEMVYFQGSGLEGAAERLGIQRSNAKTRLVRARSKLAQKLARWREIVEEP